ncbi:hypothetical protein Bca52824_028288 [Brassica carinata]|uniref:Uncharacterized protein n=1 Tax=Brassica carinata TaxID=52824 RepID=A0A8X7VBY5_BRACI|nr:hypothetical protein Bca52824_028288 [Brassica carinata]
MTGAGAGSVKTNQPDGLIIEFIEGTARMDNLGLRMRMNQLLRTSVKGSHIA